jgi:hypothetical protein
VTCTSGAKPDIERIVADPKKSERLKRFAREALVGKITEDPDA